MRVKHVIPSITDLETIISDFFIAVGFVNGINHHKYRAFIKDMSNYIQERMLNDMEELMKALSPIEDNVIHPIPCIPKDMDEKTRGDILNNISHLINNEDEDE